MDRTALYMKRLDTVLPEWTRTMWASEQAKAAWQSRINDINGAWVKIERWSVIEGARGSCLTFTDPQGLPDLARWASKHGVLVLPVAQVGSPAQYSATPQAVVPGQAWQYRIVMCRPEFRDAWFAAWEDNGNTDDNAIGELLGFPKCCQQFFRKVWVEEKFLDTSWPMAVNTFASKDPPAPHLDHLILDGQRTLKLPAELPIEANILLRWLGVRAVTHLPCSFDCQATVEVAKMFDQVGRDHDFGEEIDWTREMLSWPVEWSALHGIAELKTPILKVSSRTDMTAEKYVVQRKGSSYPSEGLHGLVFPYRLKEEQVQLTKTPSFARGIKAGSEVVEGKPAVPVPSDDLWTDNGFSSLEAMNAAHSVLLSVAPEELKAGDVVLDLGCGNGRLLECLGEKVSGLDLYGIEMEGDRCRRAGGRFRDNGKQILIYEGSLFDQAMWTEEHYDLVFFMPGRVLELRDAGAQAADTLRELLLRSRRVIFYAYGDWLEKHDDIVLLLAESGFGKWRLGQCMRAVNVQAVQAKKP